MVATHETVKNYSILITDDDSSSRETLRDIIQPEYLREVKRVGGQLVNVELETLGAAVKDPWKELQKKK